MSTLTGTDTVHHLVWLETTVAGRPATYGTAGQGPPLLFLHGWGLGYRSYKRALKRLVRSGYRVYAPALPGFGGTAALPPEEFGLEGYADWVAAFLAAVDVDEPVLLIGHSFGGGVAIQTAHDWPDAVASLVLVNSIGGSAWSESKSAVRTMAERPLWDWGLHFQADLLPIRQITKVLPVILEDLGTNLRHNTANVWRVGKLARYADLTDELVELGRRRLPVVVLWGRSDRILPMASFESLCRAVGVTEGSDNVVMVDGNHSWLLADPEGFAEVMTNVVPIAAAERIAEGLDAAPRGRPVQPSPGSTAAAADDTQAGGLRAGWAVT
jgi:pimeloyl-ACP methyl ester carboxylesterase